MKQLGSVQSFPQALCCRLLVCVAVAFVTVATQLWELPGQSFTVQGKASLRGGYGAGHFDAVQRHQREQVSVIAEQARSPVSASSLGTFALTCGAASLLLAARLRMQRTSGKSIKIIRLANETVAADTEQTDVDEETESKQGKVLEKLGPVPEDLDWDSVDDEWELDCFSRPVLRDGKKVWELLLTDSNAVYRRVAQMKPARVNSVIVQKIVSVFIDESKVKPKAIRFYRKVMKNMLTVALLTMKDEKNYKDIEIIASRNCHTLRQWISYRERAVYPAMDGYVKTNKRKRAVTASGVNMTPDRLPSNLRFERYAFSAIPLGAISKLKPGQLPGKLCRVPGSLDPRVMIHGVIMLTERAEVIVQQLKSLELCAMRVNLETNHLLMDLGIDETFMCHEVPADDRDAVRDFERSKRALGGLHFIAVHNPVTGGEANLPIEAEDMGDSEGSISAFWLCMDYAPSDNQ